ncbi:MAG: hypothetical protein ACRC6D_06340 [Aeromonas sp.]
MAKKEVAKSLIEMPVELRLQLRSISAVKRITMAEALADYLARGIITDYQALGMLECFAQQAKEISRYIIEVKS